MKPQIVTEKMKKLLLQGRMVRIAVFTAIAATALLLTGALYFRESVYITDAGITREVKTNEYDVYAILKAEKYDLGPDDTVKVETDENKIRHITIDRSFNISVTADGATCILQLSGGTVKDALEEAGIELGKDDVLSCKESDELYPEMDITVTRVKYVDRKVSAEKPCDVIYKDNSNLVIGTENVISEGENGECIVYYRDTYVDGKLLTTKQYAQTVTKEPVSRVVERGTALATPYVKMKNPEELKLVNGIPENYTKIVSGKATAYSARAGALTASGRYAVVGTVAVNPNIIPYGSEVYVVAKDGSKVYGYAIAADTGYGLMDGSVAVDVFMGSYADSCKWGAVYVDIYVISEGDNRYIGAAERNSLEIKTE